MGRCLACCKCRRREGSAWVDWEHAAHLVIRLTSILGRLGFGVAVVLGCKGFLSKQVLKVTPHTNTNTINPPEPLPTTPHVLAPVKQIARNTCAQSHAYACFKNAPARVRAKSFLSCLCFCGWVVSSVQDQTGPMRK